MITRRALIAATAATACLPAAVPAAELTYTLKPVQVGTDTWTLFGAQDAIRLPNGGAIANASFIRTGAGTVVIDCGPSVRFGAGLRALAEATTGEKVVRVYLTHLHPDHVLGAAAFDPATVAATPQAIADLARDGAGFTDAMYRLLGDWMRGTQAATPGHVVTEAAETFGRHRFRLSGMTGHSASDLVIFDEASGIVFTGDLVCIDRAPATPEADIKAWLATLDVLATMPRRALVPGHGPLDLGGGGIAQTRDWLTWLEGALRDAVGGGLDMAEAGGIAIPPRFARTAMARYELERSVSHFYPRLETAMFPRVDAAG